MRHLPAWSAGGCPADDVLDRALGDEVFEHGLDHLLVVLGQVLDGLELAQQLAVGHVRGGGFVAGSLDQVVCDGVERVYEALEGGRSAGIRALRKAESVGRHRVKRMAGRYGETQRYSANTAKAWTKAQAR